MGISLLQFVLNRHELFSICCSTKENDEFDKQWDNSIITSNLCKMKKRENRPSCGYSYEKTVMLVLTLSIMCLSVCVITVYNHSRESDIGRACHCKRNRMSFDDPHDARLRPNCEFKPDGPDYFLRPIVGGQNYFNEDGTDGPDDPCGEGGLKKIIIDAAIAVAFIPIAKLILCIPCIEGLFGIGCAPSYNGDQQKTCGCCCPAVTFGHCALLSVVFLSFYWLETASGKCTRQLPPDASDASDAICKYEFVYEPLYEFLFAVPTYLFFTHPLSLVAIWIYQHMNPPEITPDGGSAGSQVEVDMEIASEDHTPAIAVADGTAGSQCTQLEPPPPPPPADSPSKQPTLVSLSVSSHLAPEIDAKTNDEKIEPGTEIDAKTEPTRGCCMGH